MTETGSLATLAEAPAIGGTLSGAGAPGADPRETDQGNQNGPVAAPGPEILPHGAVRHGCGQWWTGGRVSHCGAKDCHRTFSSITAFNRHQRNRAGGGVDCVDPATVGLVPVRKPYGILWSLPVTGDGNPHAKAAEA